MINQKLIGLNFKEIVHFGCQEDFPILSWEDWQYIERTYTQEGKIFTQEYVDSARSEGYDEGYSEGKEVGEENADEALKGEVVRLKGLLEENGVDYE